LRYTTQVKPITHLKAHAADILERMAQDREPLIITQNGEARAVLQDVASYEETQETLALLKMVAMGVQDAEAGRTISVRESAARLLAKVRNP